MTKPQPTPQQVRSYLETRRSEGGPPPSTERIREIMGWNLLPNNKEREACEA